MALREVGRARLRGPAEIEQVEGLLDRRAGRCAWRNTIFHDGARSWATARFSSTSRSSNSSPLCHVRASPSPARACAGSPPRSRPSSSTWPLLRTKPVTASTNVVLPGAVGPDQADQLALSRRRSSPPAARARRRNRPTRRWPEAPQGPASVPDGPSSPVSVPARRPGVAARSRVASCATSCRRLRRHPQGSAAA